MFEAYSTAVGPSVLSGVDLHTIWEVRADQTYDIQYDVSVRTSRELHLHGGTGLIGVRTLAGEGEVYLTKSRRLSLEADTLVVLSWNELQRYRCLGDQWCFWWFEFTLMGSLPIPLASKIPLHTIDQEKLWFDKACSLLRRHDSSHRSLAALSL